MSVQSVGNLTGRQVWTSASGDGMMIRTQVQFTEDQHERLRRAARDRGVSIAEVIRQAVDAQLRLHDPMAARTRMIEASANTRFRSGSTDIARRHDDYLADGFAG